AGLRRIRGVDVVECVLHRGGGKDRDGLVLCGGGRIGGSEKHDEGGKNSGETIHDSAPCMLAGARIARASQALLILMRQAESLFQNPEDLRSAGISQCKQ